MLFFKKSLEQAVTDFITVAQGSTEAQGLMKKADAVASSARNAKPDERQQALQRLAALLKDASLPVAGCSALVCGTLVEMGADPQTALTVLLRHTQEALSLSKAFVTRCEQVAAAHRPTSGGEIGNEKAGDGESEDEPVDVIETYGGQVANEMPNEAIAFAFLEPLCLGCIAMLSRSKEARKAAHNNETLRELSNALANYHGRADFLWKMLSVLDDEEFIVLHPAQRRGYRIQISGIADNFQLHILLAHTLIGPTEQGWLEGKKPDPDIVAACTDRPGIDAKRKVAEGAFNLVNWQDLQSDGTLADGYGSSDHWIWNEGVPDDITSFEGYRIILLGPPPYPRTWNACRIFDGMHGELLVQEQLSPDEVGKWLERLKAAV